MRRLQATSLGQLAEMRVAGDGRMAVIHAPEVCVPPCAWHAPSDHRLNTAPLVVRPTPIGWLSCRVCEHGNEHPDPDDVARLRERGLITEVVSHCECGCCPEDL
jgi:hypothetical protein